MCDGQTHPSSGELTPRGYSWSGRFGQERGYSGPAAGYLGQSGYSGHTHSYSGNVHGYSGRGGSAEVAALAEEVASLRAKLSGAAGLMSEQEKCIAACEHALRVQEEVRASLCLPLLRLPM
jgi:hypothetical protein